MYYKIIKNFKLLPPKKFNGIVIYPFIFAHPNGLNERQLNHELIHIKQQRELLVIPFYILYLVEFLFRLIQYRNPSLAYYNISFEREAYTNERKVGYLENRKWYSWMKYIKLKT